jgi:hypothetical protein
VGNHQGKKGRDGVYWCVAALGKSGSKFRHMMGKIFKSGAFIQISDDRKKIPENTKEDVWSSLMVCVT